VVVHWVLLAVASSLALLALLLVALSVASSLLQCRHTVAFARDSVNKALTSVVAHWQLPSLRRCWNVSVVLNV
jgi:hypothetical protein